MELLCEMSVLARTRHKDWRDIHKSCIILDYPVYSTVSYGGKHVQSSVNSLYKVCFCLLIVKKSNFIPELLIFNKTL